MKQSPQIIWSVIICVLGTCVISPAAYCESGIAAWSPRGDLIAAKASHKTGHADSVDIWDVNSRKLVASWQVFAVSHLVWSSKNNVLAIKGYKQYERPSIHILELSPAGLSETKSMAIAGDSCMFAADLAWSVDETMMAEACGSNEIRVWQVSDSKIIYSERLPNKPPPNANGVKQVKWASNNTLGWLNLDGELRFWKLGTPDFLHPIVMPKGSSLMDFSWSPDGKLVALAVSKVSLNTPICQNCPLGIVITDPVSGKRSAYTPLPNFIPGWIAWSPDGTSIVVIGHGFDSEQVFVLNQKGGIIRKVLMPKRVPLGGVSWSPSSKAVAISDLESGLYLLNPERGRVNLFDPK